MGIFGIHMPLLYGEGERAFVRLQEEIIKTSTDMSFLIHEPIAPEDAASLRQPLGNGRELSIESNESTVLGEDIHIVVVRVSDRDRKRKLSDHQ